MISCAISRGRYLPSAPCAKLRWTAPDARAAEADVKAIRDVHLAVTSTDVHTVTEAVSRRLKEHRKQQKISLDELSRRAGVSKGMLVEIEKGAAQKRFLMLLPILNLLSLYYT